MRTFFTLETTPIADTIHAFLIETRFFFREGGMIRKAGLLKSETESSMAQILREKVREHDF